MTVGNFLSTKERVQHCPTCGDKLVDHPQNGAIRVCLSHGDVFAILALNNGTYRVEVNLNGGSTYGDVSFQR